MGSRYLESFYNPVFTDREFVTVLFSLLHKNGINKINEKKLLKKLYYYYKNPKYKELFQDIALARGGIDNQVDLHDSLYREKYFSGNIFWDSMHSDELHFKYDKERDLSVYEKNLSEDGKEKMREMALELSIQNRVEAQSKVPLYIYKVNPNQSYRLVRGEKVPYMVGFEMITDGNISSIDYKENKGESSCFYESPLSIDEHRKLKDTIILNFNLKDATYAIKQGLHEKDIRYSILNTNIVDEKKLIELSKIASERQNEKTAITDKQPYVKKLILK